MTHIVPFVFATLHLERGLGYPGLIPTTASALPLTCWSSVITELAFQWTTT
jgi:hypothetical protein